LLKTIFSPEYVSLISALQASRKASGLSQAELAKKLDKPQSYISKIENKERRLDVIEYVQMCHSLNVDYKDILDSVFTN